MIRLESVTKYYGRHAAVKNISFDAPDGAVTGLLGKNGAGKTTILKAICALHFPSDGRIFINDIDAAEFPAVIKQQIGFVCENPVFYERYTVYQMLRFCADIRFPGKTRTEKDLKIDNIVNMFSLDSVLGKKTSALSKGFRQRTAFSLALMHDPSVLVLDEPTSGLDPQQIHDMHLLVRRFGKTKTVIISSHNIHEIETLCSNIVVLANGSVVASGVSDAIKKTAAAQTLEEAFFSLTSESGIMPA
ncbi:MAG: ABC transporter ATP-binding protein [Bacteroides sp.]|nr:ABC transporter ATP-binding protein [Prevotella sp.]MCM1407912.1 ABC transporter ATP-binding protein [Treponema brennaborense]MCM1469654.1 ABC transporter ATP-binding protein [Bacteroides sp.]